MTSGKRPADSNDVTRSSERVEHRVWAEIDLGSLVRNVDQVAGLLHPEGQLLVVLKADGYGHGAVPVSRALLDHPRVWGFGVGDSTEALEIIAAEISAPVLILGTIIENEVPQVVSHDIRVCIHSMDRIRSLEAEARRQGRRVKVHVMVDTGMGRLGAQIPRAKELARVVAESDVLVLEGLGTHPSSSRPGHPFTAVQLKRLETMRQELATLGIVPPLVHFSNTAALLEGTGVDLPLARPGISLYGILTGGLNPSSPFEPIMSLRTQVVYLKDMPAGSPVGYNGTYVTARPARIATLPVGYNDGLAYRLSNRGRCLIRGRSAPIVGAISMDYTTVDVSHIPGVSVGDTVTLIGDDGDQTITMAEIASMAGTIPYEIACSVGKRVRRVYHRPSKSQEPSATTSQDVTLP
ncbi:MAG: alanine racemase [Planctomycetota bacterium]|nr:alanine racemase [Planctomycetota bacterium]